MKKLILVMGPPGAGKTTWVCNHKKEGDLHYEGDMFNRQTIQLQDCNLSKEIKESLKCGYAEIFVINNLRNAMINSIENIYVANPFITIHDRRNYLELAREFGYIVHFVRMRTQYKNVHNVSDEEVTAMINDIQEVTEQECYGLPGVIFEEVK